MTPARPSTQSARTIAPAARPKSDPHAATRPGASARAPKPLPTGTIIAGAVGVGVLVGGVTLMLLSGSPKAPDKIAHNEEPRTTAAPANPPPPPAQTQQRVPTPAPSINTPAPAVENDETRAITAFETLKKRVNGELKDNKDVQVAAIDEYLAKYGETIAATRARVLRGEILNPRPVQSPTTPASEANSQTLTDAQKIDVVNRANEMMKNGDSAGAIVEYDKAIKIVTDGVFLVNRADIRRTLGDFEEALTDLDKAEKSGFGDWQLPMQRALIYYAMHRENEARTALAKSRTVADPARMVALFNAEAPRARVVYDGKQLEGKSISTAQEYVSRGTYRILIRKNTEGTADLEQAVKLDVSTAPSVFMTLASVAQGKKDWKARLDAYHRWADAQPESPDALNSYAWELLTSEDTSLRDFKAAIPLAEKANKLAGEKNWGILDTLALAYFRNGRAQEAVDLEKKAIEMMPGNTAASVRKEYDDHLAEFEAGLKAVK